MSAGLAIAGVSAVLRHLLDHGLINHDISRVLGSTVAVTVRQPDRLATPGASEATQLNLYLHHVTTKTGPTDVGLPPRDSRARRPLSSPPLVLDLHYLVSAHGDGDLHREILLGYAIQLLHETPVITRQAIHEALAPRPADVAALPPASRALAEAALEDHIEDLRVTPENLSAPEMAALWSATRSPYRPTAAYRVSAALVDPPRRP
jgi:hypothetical protein